MAAPAPAAPAPVAPAPVAPAPVAPAPVAPAPAVPGMRPAAERPRATLRSSASRARTTDSSTWKWRASRATICCSRRREDSAPAIADCGAPAIVRRMPSIARCA
ncbi:MAG: hypothetical protein FJ276_29035 [Planctomycetes bacterium]|nr:hypothetical protein [Planctomycetota bacterium]